MGDPCQYTCMAELSQTLITIIITQLIIGNIQETLLPKITEYLNKRQARKEAAAHKESTHIQKEANMSLAEEDILK